MFIFLSLLHKIIKTDYLLNVDYNSSLLMKSYS